jgi:hypothetical protein
MLVDFIVEPYSMGNYHNQQEKINYLFAVPIQNFDQSNYHRDSESLADYLRRHHLHQGLTTLA